MMQKTDTPKSQSRAQKEAHIPACRHLLLAFLLSTTHMLFAAASSAATDAPTGRDPDDLYHDHCSVCHGDKGDGNSHAKQGLIPPPRDFTTPESAIYLNRERMIASTTFGIPGTAMTPWKSQLSDQEIVSVVDFIRARFMMSVSSKDASRGRQVYAEYCSVCHGDSGAGAVWAMAGLSPPPMNFTRPEFKYSLSRERMVQSVTFGRVETAMTGWSDRLNASDIEAVVDYIRYGFMGIADESGGAQSIPVDMSASFASGLVGDSARGMGLYTANCATCHGNTGDGRGPRAYFINPKPRNFLHAASRATFNRPALYNAIAKGRLFAEMPAWDKVFTQQQIADTAEYVFVNFIEKRNQQ
jgi:mono/diheme cytochrome c family protein